MKTSNRAVRVCCALICASVLTACQTSPLPEKTSGRETAYVGWVRFAGEFFLYPDSASFDAAQTMKCVSGALPVEKQKEAAARFSGKRVIVRARLVPWSSLPPEAVSLNHEGSPITNWCGDKNVLFASEMKED
jgi:hypothetical protein